VPASALPVVSEVHAADHPPRTTAATTTHLALCFFMRAPLTKNAAARHCKGMASSPASAPRISAWGWLAMGLAAASVVFSWLAILVLLMVLIVSLTHRGRPAWVVGVVGGVLSTAGLLRFVVEEAMPGIVQGGQRSAEDRAVSRLREILWAEQRALELRLGGTNPDGTARFAALDALLAQEPPILPRLAYTSTTVPNVKLAGAYQYRVDVSEDGKHFWAYAWPELPGEVGNKAFVLTESDATCENNNAVSRYHGTTRAPPVGAGAVATPDDTGCGLGGDGQPWVRWKWKKVRFKGMQAPQG
jgi:hypothetical protein